MSQTASTIYYISLGNVIELLPFNIRDDTVQKILFEEDKIASTEQYFQAETEIFFGGARRRVRSNWCGEYLVRNYFGGA